MKLFVKIKSVKKLPALLLIFNFLILSGVISYHYHKIEIHSVHANFSDETNSNKPDGAYSYLTCPVIHYSSSVFQFFLEDNKTFTASEFSEVFQSHALIFSSQNSEINYNLRAPPTLS